MRRRIWVALAGLVAGGLLAGTLAAQGPRSAPRHAWGAHLAVWRAGSDTGLHVVPFPGTPDASPSTEVVFSSLAPSALRSVQVTGSRSGRHAGRLIALPDRAGTAFVPDRPFAAPESVRVAAELASKSAGRASGAPGASRLSFSFAVAAPVTTSRAAPAAGAVGAAAAAVAASGAKPAAAPAQRSTTAAAPATPPASAQTARRYPPSQHFHSMPGLGPPVVRVSGDPGHASGDIFITPGNGRQHGPMIINSRGQLVWFDHITNRVDVSNLEVKSYRGKPVLTWWEGKFAGGHGVDGRDVIMNSSYRIVKVLRAGHGYSSDLHEFQLTPHGTAFVDCYVPVHANLTSMGGPANGTVLDGVIQKLDVRTGKVLWEWHSLGHVPLSASYLGAGSGQYDYFHINSIQELPNGKVLISARNTWAVYLIDERTGRIDWTLGGKYSSFRIGPGAGFQWQHDATLHRGGLLTVFDDAAVPSYSHASSAKELRLNTGAHTASLVEQYVHSPPVVATYMGSVQLLPNHRAFVDWGNTRSFSEYAPGGRQIFNGSFLGGINSYRAYRFRWRGQPRTSPASAVSPAADGAVRVYSAWNGATTVARWRVLGGAAPGALSALGQAPARGFEAGQWVRSDPRYFAVEALDGQGHVLARSAAVARPAHLALFGQSVFASQSSGSGALPVSCLTRRSGTCELRATITSGGSVLARTQPERFAADSGDLLSFRLSSAARTRLAGAGSHHLPVKVTLQDDSGRRVSRRLELVAFATAGSGPARALSASPTIQLLGTTEFASSQGRGAILAVCYASVRCYVRGAVSAGGRRIALIPPHDLGADEVGYVPFRLTATGRSMLSQAPGNQLAAQVRLSNGSDVASGQVALVRYR